MDMEICGKLMIGQSNNSPSHQTPNPSNLAWSTNNMMELDWANSSETHHHFHFHPDPRDLMCLNLGKRHYFEDATPTPTPPSLMPMPMPGKRGKQPPLYTPLSTATTTTTTVPRCQVEGCHVALLHSKDYHRRHRVCEMHSKAPKVLLLGLHQRFCQQCSRFHVISEFDDSKRSCRRRLAGHNERRRKSSHESVAPRNSSQENKTMRGRIAYMASPAGRALSLLSSKNESWASTSELSQRSSAALRELIAENRAAILARQLILEHTATAADDFGDAGFHQQQQQGLYYEQQQQSGWERMQMHDENGGAHVTLDLMQPPNAAFGLLSVRSKSNEQEDQECCHLWNSFQDPHSHVV